MNCNKGALFAWFTAVVSLVMLFLWRIQCMPFGDDFVYSHVYQVPFVSFLAENILGTPITSWGDFSTSVWLHWLTSNGRLANILAFAIVSSPQWSQAAVCTLLIAVFPFLILTADGGLKMLSRPLWVTIMLWLVWICFPWSDGMHSTTFILNYLLPADAFLLVIIGLRRMKGMRPAVFGAFVAFAFLTAWLHEGFTIPLLAWLFMALVLCRFRDRRLWIVSAACFLGFLAVALAPGTIGRLLHGQGEGTHGINLGQLASYWMVWAYPLLLIVLAICRYRRWKELWPNISAFTVAVALVMVLSPSDRALWPAVMLACVGLVRILSTRNIPSPSRVSWVLSGALLFVWVWFMASVAQWQKRDAEMYAAVHPLLTASGQAPVFYDICESEVPWTALSIPLENRYGSRHNLYFEQMAAGGEGIPAVLPARFAELPFEEWDTIPGNNPFRGTLLTMLTDKPLHEAQVTITFGKPLEGMAPVNRWLVESGGEKYRQLTVTVSTEPSVEWRGRRLYRVFLPPLKRYYAHREILSLNLN